MDGWMENEKQYGSWETIDIVQIVMIKVKKKE